MSSTTFDQDAWLRRIGHDGSRAPTLETLRNLVAAQGSAIVYETVDPLLGRLPRLDVVALMQKMVHGGRGGYCFELNTLFRAGLRSLGFQVTSLQARVIRNLSIDAERPALHMLLRVDLPEGAFLADVGAGHLAPTAPLALQAMSEQATPHETMRLLPLGHELVLQARLGDAWEHRYRVALVPQLDADYEVANWFTATHPDSVLANNFVVTRPGPDRTRLTLVNERLTIRRATGETDRRQLSGAGEIRAALADLFGLMLSEPEISAVLQAMERKGRPGTAHPFFT